MLAGSLPGYQRGTLGLVSAGFHFLQQNFFQKVSWSAKKWIPFVFFFLEIQGKSTFFKNSFEKKTPSPKCNSDDEHGGGEKLQIGGWSKDSVGQKRSPLRWRMMVFIKSTKGKAGTLLLSILGDKPKGCPPASPYNEWPLRGLPFPHPSLRSSLYPIAHPSLISVPLLPHRQSESPENRKKLSRESVRLLGWPQPLWFRLDTRHVALLGEVACRSMQVGALTGSTNCEGTGSLRHAPVKWVGKGRVNLGSDRTWADEALG